MSAKGVKKSRDAATRFTPRPEPALDDKNTYVATPLYAGWFGLGIDWDAVGLGLGVDHVAVVVITTQSSFSPQRFGPVE